MSRKDYVAFANTLSNEREMVKTLIDGSIMQTSALETIRRIEDEMVRLFKRDNSNFDVQRFYAASGRNA
jgi:hypothetical protein